MARGVDKTVAVARIADAHGLRGDIKLLAYTKPCENLLGYKDWIVVHPNGDRCRCKVQKAAVQGKFVVATLQGYADRDVALSLKGCEVHVPVSDLPRLEPNDYYWIELIGLEVTGVDGTFFGHIESIMETGANDVFVVQNKASSPVLIPYIPDVIRGIDLEKQVITVDWTENF